MVADVDIAGIGALLGDRARAAMLLALLGGRTLSAGELARIAGVSPSGASAHLRRLREGGLVTTERVGRQRLVRLASGELAAALETVARVAPPRPPRTLRESAAAEALKRARTCYDHLAGELGVAVTDALLGRDLLTHADDGFAVTRQGARWFARLGIEVATLERQRRSFARDCLDWSERRPHLAGSLGAALATTFLARGWVRHLPGGRALAVSDSGRTWLARELGIE